MNIQKYNSADSPISKEELKIEERVLHKLQVAIYQKVSSELLACSVSVDKHIESLSTYITCSVRGHLFREDLPGKKVTYPLTWVDAVKLRWYPAWLLSLFPAKMKIVDIWFDIIYPDFKPAIPDSQYTVVINSLEKP